MAILSSGNKIGEYIILSLIKENPYTETYRVEDVDHNPFFLKIFNLKTIPQKLLEKETGEVRELALSGLLQHRNLMTQVSSGMHRCEQGDFPYYVTNFFSGEILADRLCRHGAMSEEDAVSIYLEILSGLNHIHEQSLVHNDITPRNIMLSENRGVEIIDLGHISECCSGIVPFDVTDLEPLYLANETFAGIYDESCDIFSATAVLYAMLSGKAPWGDFDSSKEESRGRRAMRLKEFRRSNPIDFSALNCSDAVKAALATGLSDGTCMVKTVPAIVEIVRGEASARANEGAGQASRSKSHRSRGSNENDSSDSSQQQTSDPNFVEFEVKRGGGNGFQDIAGMNDLKSYLTQRIIFVLQNKELAEKYKLTPPNAMLLYGPPGCGKTFIAEKFAEETKFSYILIKSSDLASSFVHGSQQKIAKLFSQAEKNAPVVICFDEFDALVPDRSQSATQYVAGEVNEFLSQLNNCSKRGIFVIATSNRPDKIDPAVLRTGRIDKQVFVPLPDAEARGEMFRLHLKGRPMEEEIDFDRLSTLTDGYIASDIAFIVNEAAMVAAFTGKLIGQELLEQSISNIRPSLGRDILEQYDQLKNRMDGIERRDMASRRRIGYTEQ